jgi:peptidoglycan hydrolase-like protein with peptidoglycan-binding domain
VTAVADRSERLLVGAVASEDVAYVQRALDAAGYTVERHDAIYGPETAAAVRRFQADHGLDPDGIVGPATYQAIVDMRGPGSKAMETRGFRKRQHGATSGEDVAAVQGRLAALGYDPGDVDGVYGPRTAAAVHALQQARGLPADGIVGPATRAALAGEDHASAFALLDVTPLPPAGDRPLLGATVLDGVAVAVVEVGTGVLGCVDLADGTTVAEMPSRQVSARPVVVTAAPGTGGPAVVGLWSDAALRLWFPATGEVVAEGLPELGRIVQLAALVGPSGAVHVVGRDRGDALCLLAEFRRAADGPFALRHALPVGDVDVAQPVLYASGDEVVVAGIDRAGQLLRMILDGAEVSARLYGHGPIAAAGGERYPVEAAPRVDAEEPPDTDPGVVRRLVAGGTPDRPALVTADPHGEVVVLSGDDLAPRHRRTVPYVPAAADAGERTLALAEDGTAVHLHDLASGEPVAPPVGLPHPDAGAVVRVVDAGDQPIVVVADTDHRLWVWRGPESEWRQPNPSLARDYWTTADTLGYGAYARAIAEFIQHDNTTPPLTIGIKGPWGAGKTSVMRMVQAQLDPPVDPRQSEWRFRDLSLTPRGTAALTEGAPRAAAVSDTTVKTVLDRAAAAPVTELDLGAPTQAGATNDAVCRPTVWFNPWMYQTGEQLWAGLAHEIISQITGRLPRGQRERFWLELNLRRVNREALRRRIYGLVLQKVAIPIVVVLAGVVAGIACALAGVDPAAWAAAVPVVGGAAVGVNAVRDLLNRDAAKAVPQMVEGPIGATRDDLAGDLVGATGLVVEPDYQSRAGFLYFVQTDMKHVLDLVATPQRPLVVFIDDLDRCSPGVVTQTIEAVNLFLAGQFPHCIFVLAIEPAVVAAHIETAHKDLVSQLELIDPASGWSRLGWRFLEKIVQLPLALPQPRSDLARRYVLSLFAGADDGGGGVERASEADLQAAAEAELEALEHRQASPGLAAVPRERADVERRLRDRAGFDAAAARSVADDVAVRRFARTFSDEDDDVRNAIVTEALALPQRNPREMKRLVNLFRFYALIVNERRVLVRARSQTEVFAQVARLAALTNRWPHLLGALGAPSPGRGALHEEGRLVFEDLERAAGEGDDVWDQALASCGLTGGATGRPEPDGLRDFLQAGPRIGPVARELL